MQESNDIAHDVEAAASGTGSSLDPDEVVHSSKHDDQLAASEQQHGDPTTSDAASCCGESDSPRQHAATPDHASSADKMEHQTAFGTLVPEDSRATASPAESSASGSLYAESSEVLEVFAGAGGLGVPSIYLPDQPAGSASQVDVNVETAAATMGSPASSSSGSVF